MKKIGMIVLCLDETFKVYAPDMTNITKRYLQSISTAKNQLPLTDEVKNVYGRIPYLELRLNNVTDDVENGLWELIRAQLDYNRLSIMDTNNAVYNGFSIMAFINFGLEKSNFKVGAGSLLLLDDADSGLIPKVCPQSTTNYSTSSRPISIIRLTPNSD